MTLGAAFTDDGPTLPRPPKAFRGSRGRTYADSEPSPLRGGRPTGEYPNVILVLLDDVGFGQPSTFGGPVPMPTLDGLAARGIRYNAMHTTGLCSPTRAALLTGRNHHVVGAGVIAEMATGFPGYTALWPPSTASVAETLRQHGYATAALGKWHNTPDYEASPVGPFERWPTGLGFEYFYGFLGGDCDQWHPTLVENTRPVDPPTSPESGYHLDADLADRAIMWLRQQWSVVPEQPVFLYYAPGTAHAPHHAPADWLKQFRGVFDGGWDRQREETFRRQQELGIVPATARLTPRPPEIPAWDSLGEDEKRLASRLQEAFAAALAHCDYQIGRVFDEIDRLGKRDNTLVIYVAGDNGPSGEGTLTGQINAWAFLNGMPEEPAKILDRLDDIGGPKSFSNYPVGWGWAGSAPLQWLKQIASHFGATRNGMVISWPDRLNRFEVIRDQFLHCIDIAPTILHAAGIREPHSINGVEQRPIDGVSFADTFESPAAASQRRLQYFEIFGHRALYYNGWVAGARHGRLPWELSAANTSFDDDNWELYNVAEDFSQAVNLAGEQPGRLRELQDLWWAEAGRNDVLPLDDRFVDRLRTSADKNSDRSCFVYYDGAVRIPESSAPDVKGRSHRILANVTLESAANGILVAAGGRFGGYALYLSDGHLHYVNNVSGVEQYVVISHRTIPAGELTLGMEFTTDRPVLGSGGDVLLLLNGDPVGRGRAERTVPFRYSFTETFNVGRDAGSPVDDGYEIPFPFSGQLHQITVELLTDLPQAESLRGRERHIEIERATE